MYYSKVYLWRWVIPVLLGFTLCIQCARRLRLSKAREKLYFFKILLQLIEFRMYCCKNMCLILCMKETSRNRRTATSSLNETFTDQLGNRMVAKGVSTKYLHI